MTPRVKRINGLAIIVITSFLLFFVLCSILYYLYNPDKSQLSAMLTTYLFFSIFCYLGLRYGINLFKDSKVITDAQNLPILPGESVKLHINISINQYRKLTFYLTYRHPAVVYITAMGIMGFISTLIQGFEKNNFAWAFGLFVAFLPISVYWQANKNYNSNNYLKEKVDYEFNSENIILNGETFNTIVKWTSMHRVKEINIGFYFTPVTLPHT